jgi:hypothetical protein
LLIALLLAWRPKLTAAPWLALRELIVEAGAEGVINGLSRVEGDHGSDVTFYGSVLACVGAGVLYARLTAPPPDQRPGLLVSVLGAIILGVPLAIGVSELDSESGHPERWISLGLVIVAVAVLGAATLTRWRGRFPALLMVVSGAAACGFVVFDLWGFKDVIAFVGALLVLAGGLLAAGLPRSQAV